MNTSQLLLLVLCPVIVAGRGGPRRPHRDVTTLQGAARGYLWPRPPHYAFLGLPYARPPTRADRFKAPEPPPEWDGVFEATHRVKCPQPGGEGEENCLVVNVFAPEHAAQCCMLPVLMHVHDGAFYVGSGAFQPPSRLLLEEFVIVTFNYRLGALGFLCLGTPGAPGNAGLKDQVAAIYWVHKNIESFGGNPLDITLYGTGSGAASIQLLLLSGMMKGFIKRVILESGSVLSPASMSYNPLATALDVAISFGYENEGDVNGLETFYKKLPVGDLVNISTMFLPCVENNIYYSHSLLDRDPVEILSKGDFDKVPMLMAYTSAAEIAVIEDNSHRFIRIPEDFEDLLPNNLEFESNRAKHKVADLIKEFYFQEHEFTDNILENYMDYFNDILMEYPAVKFSILYASKSMLPVYVMKFTYSRTDRPGARHGDILGYIYAKDVNSEEELIAQKLVTLWINFIKLGDPTPLTTSLIPVIWQPVNTRERDNVTDINKASCLLFDRVLTMSETQMSQSLVFWDHLYSKFYKVHTFDIGNSE